MVENRIRLLMDIHSHQPVGNFQNVFEEAYEKAYLPFVEVLARHPKIRLTLHYSGCLFDWFAINRPSFLNRLKALVKSGQVEIMTGGYYEPILPLIPDRDKNGQIKMLTDYINKTFSFKPRGLWLTERIWEPHLAKSLHDNGILYTIVDDFHFKYHLGSEDDIFDYYVTEEEGSTLFLFASSKKLRYFMPFKLPNEVINYLKQAISGGAKSITYGDDGEKFGLWPGTHKWVYQEGWLENFFRAVEENEWIETTTFGDYIKQYGPKDRVYLAPASYTEMMQWSGGYFKNFFTKYTEANNMHKKMLYVSDKISRYSSGIRHKSSELKRKIQQATRELYMGQCNCAYWHGVFGGLYLGHLRNSVYNHLIEAERIIDSVTHKGNWLKTNVVDFDKDGFDEVLLETKIFNIYVDPKEGGTVFELDYKPWDLNLINTLTRRPEAYHKKIMEKQKGENSSTGEKISSIHDISRVKESNLHKYLNYDKYRKVSLIDHFLDEGTTVEDFYRSDYNETADFLNQKYEYGVRKTKNSLSLELGRTGYVKDKFLINLIKILKVVADKSDITIFYKIENLTKQALKIWFGTEFNLSLGIERLNKTGTLQNTKEILIEDKWFNLKMKFLFDKKTDIWYFPVETVSDSESGVEKTYQQTTLFFNWSIDLKTKGVWAIKIVGEIL